MLFNTIYEFIDGFLRCFEVKNEFINDFLRSLQLEA